MLVHLLSPQLHSNATQPQLLVQLGKPQLPRPPKSALFRYLKEMADRIGAEKVKQLAEVLAK
jgi:hypothetical protein